jgi:hypothetical protein
LFFSEISPNTGRNPGKSRFAIRTWRGTGKLRFSEISLSTGRGPGFVFSEICLSTGRNSGKSRFS